MAQFHETVMGHRFYEADIPRMVKALERLAAAVERLEAAARAPVEPAETEKKGGE